MLMLKDFLKAYAFPPNSLLPDRRNEVSNQEIGMIPFTCALKHGRDCRWGESGKNGYMEASWTIAVIQTRAVSYVIHDDGTHGSDGTVWVDLSYFKR